jgi:hypothetical protein
MLVNRKCNNLQVEKMGDYVHLYLDLTEIVTTDEDGASRTEYEGYLTVMETTLDQLALEDYKDAIIAFAPAKSTKEAALLYLDRTDYTVIKCTELGLSMLEEYPEVHALRATAREIVRLES